MNFKIIEPPIPRIEIHRADLIKKVMEENQVTLIKMGPAKLKTWNKKIIGATFSKKTVCVPFDIVHLLMKFNPIAGSIRQINENQVHQKLKFQFQTLSRLERFLHQNIFPKPVTFFQICYTDEQLDLYNRGLLDDRLLKNKYWGENKLPRTEFLVMEKVHRVFLHDLLRGSPRFLESFNLIELLHKIDSPKHKFGFYFNDDYDNTWNPDWMSFFLESRLYPEMAKFAEQLPTETDAAYNYRMKKLHFPLVKRAAKMIMEKFPVYDKILLHGNVTPGCFGFRHKRSEDRGWFEPLLLSPKPFFGDVDLEIAALKLFVFNLHPNLCSEMWQKPYLNCAPKMAVYELFLGLRYIGRHDHAILAVNAVLYEAIKIDKEFTPPLKRVPKTRKPNERKSFHRHKTLPGDTTFRQSGTNSPMSEASFE